MILHYSQVYKGPTSPMYNFCNQSSPLTSQPFSYLLHETMS